ncbi:hypothetical protein MEO40_17720 [Dolichospermum sp. ST_sed1]|nr:hypothetical protein [Dolichospermum sp. ST_sed1]
METTTEKQFESMIDPIIGKSIYFKNSYIGIAIEKDFCQMNKRRIIVVKTPQSIVSIGDFRDIPNNVNWSFRED